MRSVTRPVDRVRDRHFGYPKVAELAQMYAEMGAAIRADHMRGATVHHRLPLAVRLIPLVVVVLDALVLITFTADIFNVDLNAPRQTPIPFLAALLLAILGAGVGYVWLSSTGDRLRTYRNKLGEIEWRALGTSTWILVAISVILIAALALLMYVRVSTEALQATNGGTDGAASVLGQIFAVLSAVVNLAVIAIHALDGSQLAADMARAGQLLKRYEISADSSTTAADGGVDADVVALQRPSDDVANNRYPAARGSAQARRRPGEPEALLAHQRQVKHAGLPPQDAYTVKGTAGPPSGKLGPWGQPRS